MNILNIFFIIYACLPKKSLFHLRLKYCKLHKSTCHPMKCDIIIDIKLFLTEISQDMPVLPLVDVFGVFTPSNHSRTSKNDIADVTGLSHIPEDVR